MATARCYACHTLRPLSDFSYRRKDSAVSATSQFRRYLCVLLRRVDSKPGNGGVIYRYRCVHPRNGACPKVATEQRPRNTATQIEVYEENEYPSRLNREIVERESRHEDQHNAEMEIEACENSEGEFRTQKEEAIKRLRQCVGTTENPALSP
jgi:hypothetical protein